MELLLLPAALLVSLASGFMTGRWVALIVPLVLVPLFYAGLRYGWWGYGVSDGWQFVGAIVTAIAMAATAAMIAVSPRRE